MQHHIDTPGRIIHLWMEITRLLRKQMVGCSKPHTMNPMQVHAMLILAEHPQMTMKEFADQMHVASPTATSLVDRLVKMQWVRRSADPANRKLVRLSMLPTGSEALEQAMKEHSAVMHELFSLLSLDDQSQLEHVLLNLKEALAERVSSR